jgi:hypothetical protein
MPDGMKAIARRRNRDDRDDRDLLDKHYSAPDQPMTALGRGYVHSEEHDLE